MKAQRESRGKLYSLFNLDARWGWVVNARPRPLYSRERDLVPILQEAGWVPGLVWTRAENLAPTEIRSLYCPAHSESILKCHIKIHVSVCAFCHGSVKEEGLAAESNTFPEDLCNL
jgi:hypothetical protein